MAYFQITEEKMIEMLGAAAEDIVVAAHVKKDGGYLK